MSETIEINGRHFRMSGSRPVEVYPGTITLRGIGRVPARPARELKVGDRLMWNGGYTYMVVAIRPSPSGKSLEVDERNEKDDKVYTRRLGANRLVAIVK